MKEMMSKRDEKVERETSSNQTLARLCSRAFWQPFACIGVLYGLSQFSGVQLLQVYTVNIFR